MKYCKNKTMISLILFSFAFSIGFCQEKSTSDNFIFKTEVHVDLLFHALAHMDLGNDASNLYSEDYIKNISMEKQKLGIKTDLKNQMDSIKEIFISDNSLRMINFIPFYIGDYEEFIRGLRWLATDSKEKNQNETLNSFKTRVMTSQKQRDFISEFSRILDNEYQTFYRDCWKKEQGRLAAIKGQFEEFVTTNGEKIFSPIMKKEKKDAVVYLCLSMTRNGRGFGSRNRFGAAIKFPEKGEEFLPRLIMAIHEMTHQFSDALVMKAENIDYSQSSTMAGSEGYRVHMASEYGVIYAEYLLFQKFLPEYLRDYVLYFSDDSDKKVKDKTTEELVKIFKTHIKLSDKSIGSITDYINKL
jgi:hypothetical protein